MQLKTLLITCIFTFSGCSSPSKWHYLPYCKEDKVTLFVVSHGWHTGIVIKGDDITNNELSFLDEHLGKSKYYEIGWGDKGFYEAKEITSKITMQAIFWPTESVMHIVSLPEEPSKYFLQSKIIAVNVSKNGLSKLEEAIASSFKRENGNIIKTKSGLYGNSLFFKGNGNYHITNTCNTWTAKMLEAAGVPISPFLTLTAGNIMRQTETAVSKYSCRT